MTSVGSAAELPAANGNGTEPEGEPGALDVFRNRPFLLLWLSQVFTQIGGNMVLFGLTVIVLDTTKSNTAVSILILSFLGPAVLLSAVAGVYVDRLDKRLVLVATNLLRAGIFVLLFALQTILPLVLLLNAIVSTITVFFAPAEASMIPQLVPRKQLVAANGVFTLTLNAAFAVGYALLGGIVVTLVGASGLILVVAGFYLVAALFCWWLPPAPPVKDDQALSAGRAADEAAAAAVDSTFGQLREGIGYIRENRSISWSLIYLGIAASLVGVLGVLGPDFAKSTLGLEPKDFAVIVLPLGFGIVMGILVLNSWGHLVPRRRLIESGLIALGVFVLGIVSVGPVSRFLLKVEQTAGLVSLADFTSLISIVVVLALLAGVAYAFVAIPAQTQLQEELPEDVRGRVFGVLNMLVSTASFLPIIIVGPLSDLISTMNVLYLVAISITLSGVISIIRRGPLKPAEVKATAVGPTQPAGMDPVAIAVATELGASERRGSRRREGAEALSPIEPPSAVVSDQSARALVGAADAAAAEADVLDDAADEADPVDDADLAEPDETPGA
ncbi:MAG: MFS transporter [Chloroflexota bacterium]